MNAKCKIIIDFLNKENAEKVLKSIEVDNLDYVKTEIISNNIIARIESKSIPSMIHTLDDYLACVNIASKIVDKN